MRPADRDFCALLDAPADAEFTPGRSTPLDPAAPAVRRCDVRVRHAGAAAWAVLTGIYLDVAPGERIGLVGATGCG